MAALYYYYHFPLVCETPMSIAFVVDSSGSINHAEHQKLLEFLVRLTDSFVVGKDETQFAMVQFSYTRKLEFSFSDKKYWDPVELKRKIKSAELLYGNAPTSNVVSL